ncbi:hypothetical protein B0H13DRAFT_1878930 [Mycena leptocephala]|nr:hypothetical protein B0H13DRAFT_1878930 [Mycena leptocephala]
MLDTFNVGAHVFWPFAGLEGATRGSRVTTSTAQFVPAVRRPYIGIHSLRCICDIPMPATHWYSGPGTPFGEEIFGCSLRTAPVLSIISGCVLLTITFRAASPTRLMRVLNTRLAEVEELSERIFGVDPFLGFPPADTALMHQLIKLQDTADNLQVQTLSLGTSPVWWGKEILGCFNGLSFAILRGIWQIRWLGNMIKLREREKLNTFNAEVVRGYPVVIRLALRRRFMVAHAA